MYMVRLFSMSFSTVKNYSVPIEMAMLEGYLLGVASRFELMQLIILRVVELLW